MYLSLGASTWPISTAPVLSPREYRQRVLYEWNPNVTLLRTNEEENVRIGNMLADAANAGSSNVAVLLPLKGVSQLDRPGGPFWDPAADGACYDAIRSRLRPQIEISERRLQRQ